MRLLGQQESKRSGEVTQQSYSKPSYITRAYQAIAILLLISTAGNKSWVEAWEQV